MNVLAVIDREIARAGGAAYPDGRELIEVRAAMVKVIEASRVLSADLEHAIALANFHKAGTVSDSHPIRVALNHLDTALACVGGAS